MVKRQQFTAEFKREAVRQMRAGDKPIAQLSRELGIPRNRLYKWNQAVEAHGEAGGGVARLDGVRREPAAGQRPVVRGGRDGGADVHEDSSR